MVTQKDIAREAGVSSVTVSNVVNGNYHKVSEENIKKIQGLIEKYHYLPNATARSLAKKESQIIGVVIPNISKDDNFLESPYYARVLGVLEQIVRNKGYYLMVRCVGKCTEIIPHLSAWNVDGVIFLGHIRKMLRLLRGRRIFLWFLWIPMWTESPHLVLLLMTTKEVIWQRSI